MLEQSTITPSGASRQLDTPTEAALWGALSEALAVLKPKRRAEAIAAIRQRAAYYMERAGSNVVPIRLPAPAPVVNRHLRAVALELLALADDLTPGAR